MKNMLIFFLTGVVIFTVLFINNDDILKGESLKGPKTDSTRFYMEMPNDEIKKMFNKISNIKIGASYKEIIELIGPPTYDKKLFPKEPPAKLFRRVLDYYVKKYEKDFVNEKHDMFIRFELDKNDNLLKIGYIPDSLWDIVKQ